jgi:hypothetical protein
MPSLAQVGRDEEIAGRLVRGVAEIDAVQLSLAVSLRAYGEQVTALATGKHGLSAQQLVHARTLTDEIVGPVPVGRDLIARLTLVSFLTEWTHGKGW